VGGKKMLYVRLTVLAYAAEKFAGIIAGRLKAITAISRNTFLFMSFPSNNPFFSQGHPKKNQTTYYKPIKLKKLS